ncbi:MAG: sigma-70 family RNA polymerase sigma factor [Phycisphaerales bacterium]|nr:sigma-70 family RNA polymerase sigma factor [Phycisphaerales bacterium]
MGATITKDSGIQTYLRQISESPLLSADEERELAGHIRRAKELAATPTTSMDDLRGKEQAERDASVARDRLVRSNLRLVVNIAKRFSRRGMPLSDLIEEGNLGLIRAVEGYDADQNTRFSTYASWWIKQAIKRSLINSRQAIHIPAYMVELIARWKEARSRFVENQGRQPTLQELAEHMNVPERKVQMIRRAVKAFGSSSQSGSEDIDVSLSETLTDTRTPQPDEAMFSDVESHMLQGLLDEIDEREATILKMRFGLENGEGMTLKDIGAKIGLTRERVRQIQDEALRKLEALLEEYR